MENLKQYLNSFFRLSTDELEAVIACFKPEKINKGESLLRQDSYSKRLSFIDHGYIRVYAIVDGKEITQWISSKGYFVTDLNSFFFGYPARWNLQALTDATLFSISKGDYEQLVEALPGWEKAEKQFIAHCFVTLENRVFSLISLNAEERYKQFFSENKELFNEVPLQYLASMLGMSPETFSRIRSKRLS